MQFGLNPESAQRLDALVGTLDRLTTALNDNTAAIEAQNAAHDFDRNGPRG